MCSLVTSQRNNVAPLAFPVDALQLVKTNLQEGESQQERDKITTYTNVCIYTYCSRLNLYLSAHTHAYLSHPHAHEMHKVGDWKKEIRTKQYQWGWHTEKGEERESKQTKLCFIGLPDAGKCNSHDTWPRIKDPEYPKNKLLSFWAVRLEPKRTVLFSRNPKGNGLKPLNDMKGT